MIKKPEQIIQEKMNPSQSRGGFGGLLDYARERNENTGLSRMQNFAAALDPLIMPEMRAGEGIRERGMQRVAAGNLNKTVEWLKSNGYADAAAVIEANPSAASNVVSAILSNRMKPKDTFRIATPEEAKSYGALAGQFDSSGKFYPTQKVEMSKDLTQAQAQSKGFFERAEFSQNILNDLENQGTMMRNYIAGSIPFGNFLRTPEGQKYDQAKRDFINAILRQESGAAIGKDEFDNAELQYFPQPNDGPEVIEQKRQAREAKISGLKYTAGQNVNNQANGNGNGNGFSVTSVVPGK